MTQITVHVLRSANGGYGDTTNGGITATHDRLLLVSDDELARRGVPDSRYPVVRLTETTPGYKVLVPIGGPHDDPSKCIGPMAGGNYAVGQYGDDGRKWRALTSTHGALPVHDRFETQAQYNALSR